MKKSIPYSPVFSVTEKLAVARMLKKAKAFVLKGERGERTFTSLAVFRVTVKRNRSSYTVKLWLDNYAVITADLYPTGKNEYRMIWSSKRAGANLCCTFGQTMTTHRGPWVI